MFQKPIEDYLNNLKEMKWIDDWHILKRTGDCHDPATKTHEGGMFDALYLIIKGDYYTVFWANKTEHVEDIAGHIVKHAHKFEF